jgi:hypothetical protein
MIKSVNNLLNPPGTLTDYLQEESALVTVDDFFKCPICFEILQNPEKCLACTRAFCGSCSQLVRQGVNKCSHCNAAPFATNVFSIFEREKLNQITFACFKCDAVYSYEHSAAHHQLCSLNMMCKGCRQYVPENRQAVA